MKKLLIILMVLTISISVGIVNADLSGDGMRAYQDIQHNTEPFDADTDGDGLTDNNEINTYGTDPTESDTDDDGLDDRTEVHTYETNPLDADSDDDGLADGEEVHTYETDPTSKYTTKNGLSDGKEIEIGTDPTKYDSSGDGIADGYAYHTEYLDPTRLNVTIEVYTDTGVSIPHSFDKVQESFDTAPVESDLGKQGINLTVLNKGTINSNYDRLSYSTYIESIYTQKYVNNDKGVYHAYITDDVSTSNVIGMTSTGTDGILIQRISSKQTAVTLQHELGHQLGLVDNFSGIDSRQYSWDQYPSVMNYSVCQSCSTDEYLQYSSGEGYDDWGYIESNIDQHMANTDVVDKCVKQHSNQQQTFDC